MALPLVSSTSCYPPPHEEEHPLNGPLAEYLQARNEDYRLHEMVALSRNLPYAPAWKENEGIRRYTLRPVFLLASTVSLGNLYPLAEARRHNPHPHQTHR